MRDGKRRARHAARPATVLLLGGVLALTACGTAGDDTPPSGGGTEAREAAAPASAARITITPDDDADNVGLNDGVQVSVADGTLDAVRLTAVDSGDTVAGSLSADRTRWQPDDRLERATGYRLAVRAVDAEGRTAYENVTFRTVSPDNSFIGHFTPEDGSTVGVGMPVSLNFDKEITEKAAVEAAVEINTSSGQEVTGHWFSGTRLDFRPQEYWAAGTEVTVDLDFDGLQGAPGVTGIQDRTFSFTVGRSQVSTVDARTKQMTVVRDGQVLRTLPISAGSDENPTYNGQMVISEKHRETRMNGATVGFTDDDGEGEYDIKDVPHAMRLSSSGTFIHGNYWSGPETFGAVNASHGCIGLADVQGAWDETQDGAWFYDNSLLGDVVTVINSPDREMAPDNGLNGWNMPWHQWIAGSALTTP
ncbi:Ig-like domain-containing protein [Streptomyces sodiiphilus]|uniref:Ig-like domain-containing protein n=1 Tax=Streptomyces sodiiphilus TaxID=226217 RepID=A0ABN2NWX0_9ACTN